MNKYGMKNNWLLLREKSEIGPNLDWGIKERFSEEVGFEVSLWDEVEHQLKKRVNNRRLERKAFWMQRMAHPVSQRLEKA